MSRQKKETKEETRVFGIVTRSLIPVPHRTIDQTVETVQGKEQSVKKLVDDFVLGKLDPRQLGGGVYDEETSDEVDPFNKPGITFEEVTQIAEAGRRATEEMKRSRAVANASADKQQDEQDKGAKSRKGNEDVKDE